MSIKEGLFWANRVEDNGQKRKNKKQQIKRIEKQKCQRKIEC